MKLLWSIAICLGIQLFHFGNGDIYLHNMRGSNNRYNENTRNRRNANRLFNSQNNNRGGYNVGNLFYYSGSKLKIEWTNQHSCGDQNNHCDVILQYMCGDLVRDGTSSSTMPNNPVQCENLDCNEDRRYGMHEDFFYHAHCRLRSRNKGLFTANQKLRESASSTRQNRKGTRYGYECQEERDYYPYWGPTPWRDIAVLTNDVSRCGIYRSESQNVKAKYACDVGRAYLYQNAVKTPTSYIPITQEECEAFTYSEDGVTKNGVWKRYEAHGIDRPECIASQPSRDNHNGNTLGGETPTFNWTIPDYPNEKCTLRIRYNISTSDYDRDATDSSFNNRRRRNAGVDMWTKFGLTQQEGLARGYKLTNNPVVNIFNENKLRLRLPLNTAQYGRTFQDRSHTFAIRPRPSDISSTTDIHNINVRGKRGNIVQVYPAVEYDFVPNTALVQTGSYVHFQWTGSNNNPMNNDGQGKRGSDRNNVVLLKEATYIEGQPDVYKNRTFGQLGASYPALIDGSVFGGLSREDRVSLAILRQQYGGDMDELDAAGTYFNLGLRKVTHAGTFNYMCTRNNNFSNRSQKGKLIVTNSAFQQQNVDQNGGIVVVTDVENLALASVEIPAQALSAPRSIELWELSPEDSSQFSPPPNSHFISRVIFFGPSELLTTTKLILDFRLIEDPSSLYDVAVYRKSTSSDNWLKLTGSSRRSGGITVQTTRGGYFVATKQIAAGAMGGLVIGLASSFIILLFIVHYYRKNKSRLKGFRGKI